MKNIISFIYDHKFRIIGISAVLISFILIMVGYIYNTHPLIIGALSFLAFGIQGILMMIFILDRKRRK